MRDITYGIAVAPTSTRGGNDPHKISSRESSSMVGLTSALDEIGALAVRDLLIILSSRRLTAVAGMKAGITTTANVLGGLIHTKTIGTTKTPTNSHQELFEA